MAPRVDDALRHAGSRVSGQRSPYPGPLGVVAAGAQADLLVLDADPLADIESIGEPARMRLIMKAGAVVKETLGAASQP